VYNISAGNEVTNLEIVKRILELLQKPQDLITYVEDRPGHDTRYSLDSSKLQTQLGWQPKSCFLDVLSSTVAWYTENGSWWAPSATDEILHPTPWKKLKNN
jgi:dTDP-glucose 4,6-dehydratase